MLDLTTTINEDMQNEVVNDKVNKETLEVFEEMINNKEKYPRYNNREDLKKALLSND